MESNILTHWCRYWNKLLTILLQHGDSVLHSSKLFIRRMYLTDSVILQNVFSENYKRMHLTT